jgi:hypothetical protein
MDFCLFLLLLGLTSAAQDIEIIESDMPEDMEKFAVAEALLLTRGIYSSRDVAKNLANKMNVEYGRQWMCFVGRNFYDLGFEIDHQSQSFISFALKETHFVLFKPHLNSVEEKVKTTFTLYYQFLISLKSFYLNSLNYIKKVTRYDRSSKTFSLYCFI